MIELDYDTADAGEFAELAAVLGVDVDPVEVASPTHCLTDWVEYDFGAFVAVAPGTFAATGAYEVHVIGDSIDPGIAVQGASGVRVGSTEEEFRATAGPVIELWVVDGLSAYGFDAIDDSSGSQASIEDGVVTDIWTPRLFSADC